MHHHLTQRGVSVSALSQDCYYKDQTHVPLPQRYALNYDEPAAFDNALFLAHLRALRAGSPIRAPVFDYTPCARSPHATTEVLPSQALLVDGILLLHDPLLRAMFDLIVYVDAEADLRLQRRVARDCARGMALDDVLRMYDAHVRPMHAVHVEAFKGHADLIVHNAAAEPSPRVIQLLAQLISASAPPQSSSPAALPSKL